MNTKIDNCGFTSNLLELEAVLDSSVTPPPEYTNLAWSWQELFWKFCKKLFVTSHIL